MPESDHIVSGSQADQRLRSDDILSVWSKTIEVQMHFNEIEMKIRALYVTVMLAVVGACGWVLEKSLDIYIYSVRVHFVIILLLAGMLAAYLFYFIDKAWYHGLLKGSVLQAKKLEEQFGDQIPALGLTSRISGASPIMGFRDTRRGKLARAALLIGPPLEGEGKKDLHSTGKVDLFYRSGIRAIQALLLGGALFGGLSYRGESFAGWALRSLF